MSGRYVTRTEWGARPARPGPGPLDRTRVEGLALHWPAMATPLRGIGAVAGALRSWQAYHQDTRGWSDIAYQEAVDVDGNVYGLRGLATQSGANGDTDVNERYGALLLVLAPGEDPTPAMVEAVRRRVAKHRELFPNSRRLVGHGEIRPEPTACPGPAVLAAIHAGTFEPRPAAPAAPARPAGHVRRGRQLVRQGLEQLGQAPATRKAARTMAAAIAAALKAGPKR